MTQLGTPTVAALVGCIALAMAATTTTSTTTARTRRTSTTTAAPFDDEDVEGTFVPFPGQRFDSFDWLLCKALDKRDSGNVVVSPIGIKLVLAMLYEGAAGHTAREIQTTLQFPVDRGEMRRNYSNILASLQATRPEYVLDIGTKLYSDDRTKIRKTYNTVLRTYYNSAVETVDFSDTQAAADRINSWVESVTKGKIQHLVTDAESMASTVLLLVNAIFFKGQWLFPFNPEETIPGYFHVTQEKRVQVKYMQMSRDLYYMDADEINAKILRLPYTGKKYSMFVVLPVSPTGLDHLVNNLNPFLLHRHLWQMYNVPVNVTMPKFSFKYTADLKSALQELGIREIFENSASLPAIVDGRQGNDRLFVTEVLQKAGVAVDELGTEAYAATEIQIGMKHGDDTEYIFNATHPFLFFIEDETTGTVIFVGKVVDPTCLEGAITTEQPTHTAAPTGKTGTTPRRTHTPRPVAPLPTTSSSPQRGKPSTGTSGQRQRPSTSTEREGASGRASSAQHRLRQPQRDHVNLWNELYRDLE